MSDNHDLLNDNDMCSFSGYEVDDVCSNNDIDACGDVCLLEFLQSVNWNSEHDKKIEK